MSITEASSSGSKTDYAGQLRDGARAGAEDVSAFAKTASDAAKDVVDSGQNLLRDELVLIKEMVSSLSKSLMKDGEGAVKAVSSSIADRPIVAIVSAFAAGVVVQMLLGHASSDRARS